MKHAERPRRLLLVEDDPDLRDVVCERLSEEGFDVQTAANGRAALERLRTGWAADAIVLDLMMPVMDGWEFRVEQRLDPVLARIPVVVLTANGSAQALAIDADLRIEKPFELDLLLRGIDQVLATKERENAAEAQAHSDRLASLGTLAAGIAHEIGNPLSAVIANVQLAESLTQRDWPNCREDLEEHLRDARAAAEIALNIVREVSSLARFSEPPQLLDVKEVLEGAVSMMRAELRHRADLAADHATVSPVRARRSHLLQVFVNLLLNAAQSFEGGERGRVQTSLRESSEGTVIVAIRDSGRGIPAHIIARVFDPFFTTKPAGHGTGLGLSTCRRLVSELGGRIGIESEAGRGTTVRVELPIAVKAQG